jgi:hypothetical protein
MALYSYLNGYPQPLPFRIEVDGLPRTDPSSFTAEEIYRAGYRGPIEFPGCDGATERLLWNGDEFEIIPLTQEELDAAAEQARRGRVNYEQLWQVLKATSVYQTLRAAAASDLPANMICTELLVTLSDARAGKADEEAIGALLGQLLEALPLTEEDEDSLYAALKAGGVEWLYTIPGYVPPEDAE